MHPLRKHYPDSARQRINKLVKSISLRTGVPPYLLIGFSLILFIFLMFDWFVSIPIRAGKIDHYILFSLSETTRFYYAKTALYNPFVFLNPNAKPIYTIVSSIFLLLFPFGLFSLKMLNSLLSVGTVLFLYKLMKKIGIGDFAAIIAITITLTFPLFFLISIASLSEMLFCFTLILSIYLLYIGRYFASSILISLMPLIRQEGGLYLVIWLFFLCRVKKASYVWILPLPLIIWVLLNRFLLAHSFIYPFFVCADMPGPTAKSEIMSAMELRGFLPLIFYHPIFFLFPVGLVLKLFKFDYLMINIVLICHCLFLILAAALQFLIIKQVSYDFRYIVILIPLMAILAVAIFDKLALNRKTKIFVGIFISIVLIWILINRINALQNNSRIVGNSLSEQEERTVSEAAMWLNDFLKTNNMRTIFYSGDLVTDKIIRRIRVYLLPGVIMYPVKEFREIYNPITFKLVDSEFHNPGHKGLILILDPLREKGLISDARITFLKKFPAASIYFYKKY